MRTHLQFGKFQTDPLPKMRWGGTERMIMVQFELSVQSFRVLRVFGYIGRTFEVDSVTVGVG